MMLTWMVWIRVQACRVGETGNLDFQSAFRLMDLEGIGPENQVAVFDGLTILETEWQRNRARLEKEQIEKNRDAQPSPKYRRK